MPSRRSLLLLALLVLLPSAWRLHAARPRPPRSCEPSGRGSDSAGGWVGCAADPGPPRELSGRERIAFGVPVPLNRASAEDLAEVPGLTVRLAAEIVADRARAGPFRSVDDLERVRGVGPKRLARARGCLIAE